MIYVIQSGDGGVGQRVGDAICLNSRFENGRDTGLPPDAALSVSRGLVAVHDQLPNGEA
jgi:hypothetical protein